MKIRSCFSEVEESEKVNCVPESAATQHIEASIKRTNDHPDNGSGLCCQYRFLDVELRIWANSGLSHRFARSWIFLKVGFRLRSTNYAGTSPSSFFRLRFQLRPNRSNYAATGQSDNRHRSGNLSGEALVAKWDHRRWAMRTHHIR